VLRNELYPSIIYYAEAAKHMKAHKTQIKT